MNPIRVLLFSNLYPSAREPTRGVFNLNRFRALAGHCEARVVAPLPWWTRLRRPFELVRVPREDSTGLPAAFPTYWSLPGLQALHGRAMYLSLRAYLRRLRREFAYDVLLAAWAYPEGVAAAHLAQELDLPLVTMVLGSDLNEFPRDPALRRQIQWGLGRSRRVVAVSRALRDQAVGLGVPAERMVVQHNGVDGSRFRLRDREEERSRLGLPKERRILGYVGNLKPEKGPDVLVEALGRLHASGFRDWELALVGSGPLEHSLRSRARELGIEERLRFVGRRPHQEVPCWLAACDLLCLPSRREGCPNVVLEALASGRPVVASRVGGVAELLDDRGGVLVPPGDPEALAAGLKRALCRTWEPSALRDTVECLSWDQYGQTLRDTLAAAVGEWKLQRSTGGL